MPNKCWAGEFASICKSLSVAFGPSAGCAINGKPLGYAMLIAKDKTAVEQLLAASSSMKPDGMEVATTKFSPGSTWKHRDIYDVLAVAESEDDRALVHDKLLDYAERMVNTGEWDPVVLLAAARAQPVQGWSGDVKQILLALYRPLFQGQAEALMSKNDVDFLENFGLNEGGLFTLSRRDSNTRKDVNQMWHELKQVECIESVSMDELMGYVGIKQVKEQALSILKKMLSDRKFTARQRVVTSCNFTFMGNPGTGEIRLLLLL